MREIHERQNYEDGNMEYAPVIIPTLNRFDHFKRCLESLEKCSGADRTEVYIGLDYPPNIKYREGWEKSNRYLKEKEANHHFGKLVVIRREINYGISGKHSNFNQLTEFIMKDHDRYIFSEDDNEFSPNFLEYMNRCLHNYQDDPEIIAVCGYSYPIGWKVSESATCLKENVAVPMFGIGFWKDKRLAYVKELGEGRVTDSLKEVIRNRKYKKMTDPGKIGYFEATCRSIFLGKKENNPYCRSSDFTLRIYLAIADKYVISPVLSKVRNHGFDGTGTCCQAINDNFGKTAGTYDYARQPIDTSNRFDLIEDTLHADEENRSIMNSFDYRSPEQMETTNKLIRLCEKVGPWAGRCYCLINLPFGAIKYFLRRIKR